MYHYPLRSITKVILQTPLALVTAILVCLGSTNVTQAAQDTLDPFKAISLDELADIKVSIISKSPQKVSDSAAAVFVITQDDIRRSGANSIPEVLRMVPGLSVSQINSSNWAVSSRGFSGRYANKLLVLMDGRAVYAPLFSGVYWNVQDTLLEDIDRIEVVRGPGASAWGANAVNGVINIITRSSEETQGNLLSGTVGSETRGIVSTRHGGQLTEDVYYRLYAKYRNMDNAVFPSGETANDNWDETRGGFRIDGQLAETNNFTLQGDIYNNITSALHEDPSLDSATGEVLVSERNTDRGHNLLMRLNHHFTDQSEGTLQAYYDYQYRQETNDTRRTFDLDYQHTFPTIGRHTPTAGLGYRNIYDDTPGTTVFNFSPDTNYESLWSLFIQDEIRLTETLNLTIGSKFEHNGYTGFEYQPSARLLWHPAPKQTFWAAISRAVRTPSRVDDGIINTHDVDPSVPPIPPIVVQVYGNKNFLSETVLAHELGYRIQYLDSLALDLSVFYNKYRHLRTIEYNQLDLSNLPDFIVQPLTFANLMDGESYGLELSADWRATETIRLQLGYTLLDLQMHRNDNSTDPNTESIEGQSPEQQLSLRSSFDMASNLELDLWLRYVSELWIPSSKQIDSYWTLDVRLGWQPVKELELAFVGKNLLDNQSLEYRDELKFVMTTEIERGFYVQATWKF